MGPSFQINVLSPTGSKQARVRIGREKMLPSWEIDFGNGFIYLLVFFAGKWGALEGEGYNKPTRGIVYKLAAAIMDYQAKNLDYYQRLVKIQDGRISCDAPHPINRDRSKSLKHEIYFDVIVGAINPTNRA